MVDSLIRFEVIQAVTFTLGASLGMHLVIMFLRWLYRYMFNE